jgi:hypothetical protein
LCHRGATVTTVVTVVPLWYHFNATVVTVVHFVVVAVLWSLLVTLVPLWWYCDATVMTL